MFLYRTEMLTSNQQNTQKLKWLSSVMIFKILWTVCICHVTVWTPIDLCVVRSFGDLVNLLDMRLCQVDCLDASQLILSFHTSFELKILSI